MTPQNKVLQSASLSRRLNGIRCNRSSIRIFGRAKRRGINASCVKKWPSPLEFLQAGERELLFPSVRGLWKCLHTFLKTCQIWNGEGDPPPVHSPLYVSIVDEIKERAGAGKGELPVGDPWDMFLPTPLVILRREAELPQWERRDEHGWVWDEVANT